MSASLKSYSRYVNLMKIILPVGIILSLGLSLGWPYLTSLNKEAFSLVDPTHPEIRENRMVHPCYMSTDEKGQPVQVNAEWAKNRTETLADLVNPKGEITMAEGDTFYLEAQTGVYDSQGKVLNLEGKVTLTSTDGYWVRTEKAHATLETKTIDGDTTKTIDGDTYIEGEGPMGKIMGQKGFTVESKSHGNVLTLKGRSRIIINKAAMKKHKGSHAH